MDHQYRGNKGEGSYERRTVLRQFGGLCAVGGAIAGGMGTAKAHHVEDIDLKPEAVTMTPGESRTFSLDWVSGHGADACFVFAINVDGEWVEIDRAERSAESAGDHRHFDKELTLPTGLQPGKYTLRVSASEALSRCPHPGEDDFPILAADVDLSVADAISVERKGALIDMIRTDAATVAPEAVADELDQRAESLLGEIEEMLSGDEPAPQYEDGLNRMIQTELTSASCVRIGQNPARETAKATTEFSIMLAFAGIAKRVIGGLGFAGSVIASKVDDVLATAKRGIGRLAGKSSLARSARQRFDEIVDGVKRRVDEVYNDHFDELSDAGEEIVSGASAINEVFDVLSNAVVEVLGQIKEYAVEAFTIIFYTEYLTQSRKTNDDGEQIQPPGIDTALDSKMDDLDAAIDAEHLESDGESDREDARRDCIESFREKRDAFLTGMAALDELEDIGTYVAVGTALIAVGLYTISLLSSATGLLIAIGGALASAASTFATVATAISAGVLALTGGRVLLGRAFLSERLDNHQDTLDLIVNYESHGGTSL